MPKIRDMAANTIIYESPLDQLKQRAELNYQNYQEEKQNTAEKYGFVTLSDKSYKAIQQGAQNIQATQGLVESLLADNDALANLGLDDSSLSQLTDVIQQASDPEAMRNDLLTAVAFSQHLNIPVSDAMQNLDSLLEAQFYTPVKRGKTAAKAIKDSIKIGDLTTDRGMLGTQLKNAEVGSEEYNSILAKLQSIDAEMESLQDWMPRPWYVSLAKLGAQSAAYSLQSAAAGGVGAAIGTGLSIGLGLAFPGLKVSTAMVTGAVSAGFRGVYGYAVESGNLYYDLVSQGIDADVAKGFSSIYGVTAAAIEQGLGGVVSSVLGGFGVPVNSVASSLVSKLMANGTLANTAAVFGTRLAANIVSEGIEEALQSLSENGATALAYAFNNKLTTTQKKSLPKDFGEVLKEAWQEGLAGAGGALFLGAAGAGLETRLTVKQGAGIAEAAKTIHSQQAYEKKAEQFKPEDISDSDWENLLSNAWEQNAEARDLSWSLSSYREAAGATIADGAVYDSSTGRAFEANTKGLEKGDLFFQESTKQTSSGTVHTVKFGNTSQVGIGAVEYDYEQRQAIGEEISEDDAALANAEKGKKYISKIGEVTYRTTDSGKMEILSSSMEKGYEGYEKQALQQVISMYPEYDVQWNNPADKQAIYDEIVSENPQGIEKGLNYGKAYDNEDTQAVKRWLGTNFSSDDAENSVMAILLQSAAKRMGLTGEQFIKKNLDDIRLIDADTEAEIRKMGKNPDFVKGFTKPIQDGARAVIYAGKNADVTTFQHELNHVLMAIGENKADFEKAFHEAIGSKGGLKRFSKFVEQNIDVITIAAKNGKYDPDFLSTLYNRAENDGRDWTRIEEEFEDQLFEAYQRKGETLNPELKGVLRRIAESFRRVYRALRNSLGVSLNEEIRDYYDRLYGFDKDGVDKGRDFSSWAYNPNLSLTQEENDAIKDKSYAEQFAYIRDKYVGTEEYMRAPNGKASNLTEKQWITVRTPAFKEWFGDWENDPENASKVVDENGEPREVYHGTYGGEFDVFDIAKGSFESDMGRGFYFTSNYYDMSNNYEEGGPDFEMKVERLSDDLMTNDEDLDSDEARKQAREILFVGGSSFDVFLNMRNPAYVDSTRLFEFESSLDMDDFSDEDEYYDAVNEEIDQKIAEAIDNAISKAQDEGIDFDEDELREILVGIAYEGGSGIAEVKERLLMDSSADNGDFADNELLRCVIEACGFDGIIDSTVSDKFVNLNIEEGTSHFIAFKPNQIKSATDNSGAFSAENNSILFQGYDWNAGMSNNAVAAYENGEMPKSKWTKEAFYDAISSMASTEVADILSKIPASVKKDYFLAKTSWHHTGKYYNRTDFYSLKDAFDGMTAEEAQAIVDAYKSYDGRIKAYESERERIQAKDEFEATSWDGKYSTVLPKGYSDRWAFFPEMASDKNAQLESALSKMPESMAEFVRSIADIPYSKENGFRYEKSKSGNYYRYGEKPASAEKTEGLERFSSDFGVARLERVIDGEWKTVETYEISYGDWRAIRDAMDEPNGYTLWDNKELKSLSYPTMFEGTALDRDNALYQTASEQIDALKAEYKDFIEDKKYWKNKRFSEFYVTYPDAVIDVIRRYPKVNYKGTYIFAELDSDYLPYEKEVLQAMILKKLVGEHFILMPSQINPIMDIFGIKLNTSSPDMYTIISGNNVFIETKYTNKSIKKRLEKADGQYGLAFVFTKRLSDNFVENWESGNSINIEIKKDFAIFDLNTLTIYYQKTKKETRMEPLSESDILRPFLPGNVPSLGQKAVQNRTTIKVKLTPTLKYYTDKLKAVNTDDKTRINADVYKSSIPVNALFQEESPQDVWLEDIAYLANGCTDYEQFRIAVEAFAMGEPTEDAEADMERIFNARNMSTASAMPYDADESIDFFGDDEELKPEEYEYYLDANGEEMDLYGERDYEMFDEETEDFIVTSWAMARDIDNETAEEAKATLENPPRMMNDRAAAFVDILSDDQQLKDYLSALRSANYIVQYGSERDLDFDPRENPERYTMLYEASNAIKSTVAPFIRNIVFVKKGDTGEVKSISERGMQIIRGIIRKNADEYMNLYYLATGNDTWKKGYDADLEIQKEADRIAADKGLSISEKRSLVQDLRDKALEDKILKTGEVTNEDIRGLVSRNKQRAELSKQEADLAKKMFDERLAFKKGELIQLTLKAQQAEESYYKARTELSELNDKLERIASRIAKRAKGMGIDTKLVQEQGKLASKKAYLERLVAQRANILKNLFNEGKYYGEAGTKKIAEIDAQMGNVLKEIVELEERDVITTDEAINKIIGLTAEIRDEKARQRLYDKVTLERWKGAKKLREAQEKADIKLRDTIYVERLKASKAKAKAEAQHDAEITWERWKGAKKLNEAQERADRNLQAQRIHDAIYYGRMINRRDQTIENLKIAKDQERAALRLKKEMTRLATGIMRAPSSAIHLDEAEQILKIQATIDPAFRKTMRVDGMTMDINDLKDMLRNDPSNPLLTMLSEDQLRKLLQKSLDQMNLAELEAVAATVKNLRDKGRAKRMEYLINQRIETANIQAMLIAQVMKSGKYKEPEIHGSFEERERGKGEKWRSIYYSTYNMARLSQMLDDDKKGNFYTLLVRRKRELQDVEARAILSRRKPVEDVLEQNGISYEDFYRESIETAIDGKKATFSLSQLAYVYLSKNNEKNRAAVAYGNLISQAEKANAKNGVNARIIGQGKDFDQARNEAIDEEIRIMGDRRYAELYEYAREAIEARPEIKAAIEAIEASLNSDRFADVVALMRREFNEEVTREAYYLPLNRVGFVGESPAERLKADILNQVPGMRASVDKGMTKERITISPRHQTEVDLDLAKVWDNSIYDQEHLLAFLEYTRQLDHVFKAAQGGRTRELREAIENSYGDSMLKRIDSYINEVANPSSAAIAKEMSAASRIVKAGRTGIYAATFGLRVSSVLNQLIASPAAFLGKASPLDMARSSLLMMAHPLQTWKEITELSSFMLNRDADVVMRMIQEYNSQQGLSEAKRMHGKALEISMLGMKWADRFAVSIGWHAIYSKELNLALESGMTEAEAKRKAVKIADEYVQETQPQGDVTEQSELVKSDAFSIIAPFQTALNTVWQNVTYDIPAAFKEGRYAEALGTAMGYVIAGVLLALVKGELAPQEDDENEGLMLARRILSASTSQFTETAPLVGDTLSWIVNLAITGEKDYIYNSSTMPLLESLRTFASRVNDREWLKALESVLYGTGQYFGAPISEIKDIRRAFEEEDWRAIIGWRN